MKQASVDILARAKRLLLVVLNGAHFPAAAMALRDAGFKGELRVISHGDWRPVIEGKCAHFIALPQAAQPASSRAVALAAALLRQHARAQAIIWVEPSPLSRRVFIRGLRLRRPVFSFYDGHLRPYGAPGRLTPPGIQHVGGRERELAVEYLRPVLRQRRHEPAGIRIGADGDGIHLREATGIQWYRRHLFAALCADELDVDLRVTYPVSEVRTAWELPWNRNLCTIPATLRTYRPTDMARRYPIEAVTGPIDLFHQTFFEPPQFFYPKSVATLFDAMPLVVPETYPERIVKAYANIIPWWRDECDHVVCISEATKRDAMALMQIPEDKLSVIYPGKHAHYYRRAEEEVASVLARYGIRPPYFLALGSLVPHKNLHRLAEAFSRLKSELNLPHQLVLVGRPGWKVEQVFGPMAGKLALEDVLFTGYVDFADVPALYSGAEAYCHPSLYEGYGLPVQEAMCCGCPVLLSNSSSLPEVAGDAGLYWDPENTDDIAAVLRRFCEDDTLREGLRERAVKRAGTFPTWREVAEAHRRVYEAVLQTG